MGNYLGAAETGRFSLFFTILFITSILARMGMDTALVRWMSPMDDDKAGQKGLYLRSLLISFGSGLIVSALVFFFAKPISSLFDGGLSAKDIKYAALLIIPFAMIHLSFEALRAIKKSMAFAFLQNVSRFLIAVLILGIGIFLSKNKPTEDPVFAYGIAVLLSALLSFFLVLFFLKKGQPRFDTVPLPDFLHTALPMMLSASVFYMLSWTDTLMLGYFEGNTSVGIYNTTFKLATLANFPIMAVSAYVAPRLSEWFGKEDNRVFKQLIKQSSRLALMGALPIILVLALFPEALLGVFGDEFRVGVFLLYILLLGQIINSLTGLGGDALQMT
jgi:O-antigen/teichoic acid export membrane protein